MNGWMTEWMNTEWMHACVDGTSGMDGMKWMIGMNEWMNEWINEWINEWMSERMNEWMNERMTEWRKDWMNEWHEWNERNDWN